MTKVTESQRSGFQAEAYVDKVVSDAGFIWNPRKRDFGIDGDIGIVDADGQVTGQSVLAQVKGTKIGFPGETDAGFRFICGEKHIDYWLGCGQPVVLICVDLVKQGAWWKRVDTWFADPVRKARRVVDFDKSADRFEVDAAASVAAICIPVGHPLPRLTAHEELTSNLLRVTAFAEQIHVASTPYRDRGDAWNRMREENAFESGFYLYDGKIYALGGLDGGPLAALCDGPVTSFSTSEWSQSDDPDVLRRFVGLLNFTLRGIHHRDLAWHREKKIVYFKATQDLSTKKIKGKSRRGRGAFQAYWGSDDETKLRFCRHYAAELWFRRWAGNWYLEICPDYHFTIDGRRESLYDAEYVKEIKRRERNNAVFALVRAWADFLRSEDTLFSRRDGRVAFGDLLTFEAGVGIDERAWLLPPPALEAATIKEQQLLAGLWDFEE